VLEFVPERGSVTDIHQHSARELVQTSSRSLNANNETSERETVDGHRSRTLGMGEDISPFGTCRDLNACSAQRRRRLKALTTRDDR